MYFNDIYESLQEIFLFSGWNSKKVCPIAFFLYTKFKFWNTCAPNQALTTVTTIARGWELHMDYQSQLIQVCKQVHHYTKFLFILLVPRWDTLCINRERQQLPSRTHQRTVFKSLPFEFSYPTYCEKPSLLLYNST